MTCCVFLPLSVVIAGEETSLSPGDPTGSRLGPLLTVRGTDSEQDIQVRCLGGVTAPVGGTRQMDGWDKGHREADFGGREGDREEEGEGVRSAPASVEMHIGDSVAPEIP